jgi:hypothetical protein
MILVLVWVLRSFLIDSVLVLVQVSSSTMSVLCSMFFMAPSCLLYHLFFVSTFFIEGGNTSRQLAGLYFYSGGSYFESSVFFFCNAAISNRSEGTSAGFISGRGEGKACLSGSNWLAKQEERYLDSSRFFLMLLWGWGLTTALMILGSLMTDDGATGSTGGNLQESVASCWTERPWLQPAPWFPSIFFYFFGDKLVLGVF